MTNIETTKRRTRRDFSQEREGEQILNEGDIFIVEVKNLRSRQSYCEKVKSARGTGLYYFGARYLDPKYSRWMSADPAAAEYMDGKDAKSTSGGIYSLANFNLYHYSNNNPLTYKDPTGKDFVWGKNATSANIAKFQKAFEYLQKSPTAMEKYMKAWNAKNPDGSKRNFTINFVSDHSDRFNGNEYPADFTGEGGEFQGDSIYWDPDSALNIEEGGQQSPALGLIHEIIHAANEADGSRSNREFMEEEKSTYDIESKIADELNATGATEGKRTSGARLDRKDVPVHVPNVTDSHKNPSDEN